MKLSIKGMAAACAILWAGAVLVGGVCHALWPSYGGAFLSFIASIYPGYHPEDGTRGIIIGTVYGLVDGGAGGGLLAWLYNRMAE